MISHIRVLIFKQLGIFFFFFFSDLILHHVFFSSKISIGVFFISSYLATFCTLICSFFNKNIMATFKLHVFINTVSRFPVCWIL